MQITNITDVFFDLDHTLWDFDLNSAKTFQKIFQAHTIKIPLTQFLPIYQQINQKYWKLYREEKIDKATLRFNRLSDTFTALNCTVSTATITKLSNDYIKYLTTFNTLCNGANAILQYLFPKYTLHIITNGFEQVQQKKLAQSNLKTYFKTITTSEMATVKKPHPTIFKVALTKANTTPKNSIMIGDNLEADIEGAIHVGMQAIFYNYYKQDLKTKTLQVKELSEIVKYL